MAVNQISLKSLLINCFIGIIIGLLIFFLPAQRPSARDTTIITLIITLMLYIITNQIGTTEKLTDPSEDHEQFELGKIGSVDLDEISRNIVDAVKSTLDKKETLEVIPPIQPEIKKITKESTGSRDKDDVINSDMPYTDYHHLPMAEDYKPDDFEYGDSFLPPEKWYPTPPFPPMCVSEKRCPVCPVYTTGAPVDVKEWNSSRRVTPPDRINTDYIKEKLNAGR